MLPGEEGLWTEAQPSRRTTWVGGLVVRTIVVLGAALGAAKLVDELLRLVWREGSSAAIDLKMRYAEVAAWFAGLPVYPTMRNAVYPPATYPMLWPFLGWLPLRPARWLWALTSLLALGWLTRIIVRESGAEGRWQTALAALLLFGMNQTGVVVGNGQLALHNLAPLVAGLLAIQGNRNDVARDVVAAGCVIFGLMKVSLAAPFLWLVLLAPGSNRERVAFWPWRSAVLVAIGYTALTLLAASFQSGGVMEQFRQWFARANVVAAAGGDYGSVHAWLRAWGLERFNSLASAALFLSLGWWLYRNRSADVWIRIGVAAIIARLWTYHRVYDDVLIALALVPLFRLAKPTLDTWTARTTDSSSPSRSAGDPSVVAATLLLTCMLVMMMPARLGTSPAPWQQIFNWSHAGTWLAMLALLVSRVRDG